jgi:hypothetical protein
MSDELKVIHFLPSDKNPKPELTLSRDFDNDCPIISFDIYLGSDIWKDNHRYHINMRWSPRYDAWIIFVSEKYRTPGLSTGESVSEGSRIYLPDDYCLAQLKRCYEECKLGLDEMLTTPPDRLGPLSMTYS